jgi:hypothetical protein
MENALNWLKTNNTTNDDYIDLLLWVSSGVNGCNSWVRRAAEMEVA